MPHFVVVSTLTIIVHVDLGVTNYLYGEAGGVHMGDMWVRKEADVSIC